MDILNKTGIGIGVFILLAIDYYQVIGDGCSDGI